VVLRWACPCRRVPLSSHFGDDIRLEPRALGLQAPTSLSLDHTEMSTNPHSEQSSVKSPRDEEELVFMPGGDLGQFDASSGSSINEANSWCRDQVRKASDYGDSACQPLHFHFLRVQIEAWFALALGLQPNSPPHEANTTPFHHSAQPHRTKGRSTIQNVIGRRDRTIGSKPRPICACCNKGFGRAQELERHVRDKHMPRRQCPFCDFSWTRPEKIKAHIVGYHAAKFTADLLQAIKTLCGRQITEFVDAYTYIPYVEAAPQFHL
jgi:hypothetical protein